MELLRGISADLRALLAVYRSGTVVSGDKSSAPRVAVVLGAEVLKGGRASRTLGARVRHAARLYDLGEVELVVLTGGLGGHPPPEAELMAGILHGEGVPESAALLEDEAESTWESAWLVAALARERGIGEVRVVTDPLHCVRTVASFREAGLQVWAEPVYDSPMWRYPRRRREQLVREMGALVWYRMRHGIGSRSRR